MPRKDSYHDVVKSALIKAGWIITHDPFSEDDERELAKGYDVKLIVFDPEKEDIIEWIE